MSIPHEGNVNRARVMPQKPTLIASKSSTGKVFLFDYTKHSRNAEFDIDDNRHQRYECRPEATLVGHDDSQGFGLSWNPRDPGHLLSSDCGGKICLYDINGCGSVVKPYLTFKGHRGEVCDVQWHCDNKNIFASVGADRGLVIWDSRIKVRRCICIGMSFESSPPYRIPIRALTT